MNAQERLFASMIGFVTFLAPTQLACAAEREPRTWTYNGMQFEAVYVETQDGLVALRTTDGRTFRLRSASLSEADRKYLADPCPALAEFQVLSLTSPDGRSLLSKAYELMFARDGSALVATGAAKIPGTSGKRTSMYLLDLARGQNHQAWNRHIGSNRRCVLTARRCMMSFHYYYYPRVGHGRFSVSGYFCRFPADAADEFHGPGRPVRSQSDEFKRGVVASATESRDGTQLALAGYGFVAVLDAGTLATKRCFRVPGGVSQVLFSPDAQRLFLLSDGYLKVIDVRTGEQPPIPKIEDEGYGRGMIWADSGRKLVIGGRPSILVDPATFHTKEIETEHKFAFSPAGKTYVVAESTGVVVLRNWGDEAQAVRLKTHSGFINAMAFSPDGQLLATGDCDGNVKLWDVRKALGVGQ